MKHATIKLVPPVVAKNAGENMTVMETLYCMVLLKNIAKMWSSPSSQNNHTTPMNIRLFKVVN